MRINVIAVFCNDIEFDTKNLKWPTFSIHKTYAVSTLAELFFLSAHQDESMLKGEKIISVKVKSNVLKKSEWTKFSNYRKYHQFNCVVKFMRE